MSLCFNGINKLKFSPNKKILAVAAGDTLYFYDKDFKFLFSKNFYDYNEKYRSIYDVIFLNNKKIAFVGWDGYVIIYDIKNQKIIKTKHLNTRLQSIDYIKNRLYVGGYDGYLYIFDKNLKPRYKVSIPTKKLSYWTFIDDVLYLDINDKLYKIDLKTKKHKSIDVDIVKLKTNQNKFVVNKSKYYLFDKDFNKKRLDLKGRFYDFYNGKKYFYALSNNEIVKFLDGKKIESARISEDIDSLAGAAEIGDKVVFVTHHKLKMYDCKTKKTKLLTQPSIRFFELYIDGDYEVAKSDNYIYVYKNLKLIKRIKNDDFIYNVKNDKIYLKAYSGIKYAIDLKTFKMIDVTKIPKTKTTSAYYSGTDGYIYYKSFATKAKERIFKMYETDKFIVAWGVNNNLYVYDKKLNLVKKIVLDKRVNALDIKGDGWLYYAIYDNVFKYKIK